MDHASPRPLTNPATFCYRRAVGAERRGYKRFACDVEAILDLHESEPVEARAIDISFSGICMMAEDHIRPGTRASVRLRLIFERAHTDALPLPATVVWCTSVTGGHQIGAKFDADMDSVTWTRLDVLLRFLAGDVELEPTTR
jgi:hypothetical protein